LVAGIDGRHHRAWVKSWLMTGIKRSDYVSRVGDRLLSAMASLVLSSS
jgi:hypothetical protein